MSQLEKKRQSEFAKVCFLYVMGSKLQQSKHSWLTTKFSANSKKSIYSPPDDLHHCLSCRWWQMWMSTAHHTMVFYRALTPTRRTRYKVRTCSHRSYSCPPCGHHYLKPMQKWSLYHRAPVWTWLDKIGKYYCFRRLRRREVITDATRSIQRTQTLQCLWPLTLSCDLDLKSMS